MFISKTNVLRGRSPSVSTGISSDVPSNMTNPDFSLNYTAGGNRVVMSFGAVSGLDYVAVCASNLGEGARVVARNGSSSSSFNSVRGQYETERDHVCMFNFERENFSNLVIVIDTESNLIPTINYVAAGQAIQVPNNGEVAGYNRNWLNRGLEYRVQGSDLAAPVAMLKRRMSLKGTLSLPHMKNDFVRNDWQQFIDHASSEPFFICEQERLVAYSGQEQYRADGGLPESSYICFNPKFSAPSAHQSTRALQNIRIGFDCYNGI